MKTAITFLKCRQGFYKTIDLINASSTDYIHVDVIDGLFAANKTFIDQKMFQYLKESPKPKDVHLMTLHLKKYIDVYANLNPFSITYQFEATTNHKKTIDYIKSKKCKVGIAISPLTDLEELMPYLNQIDLVLVMTIIPGYGGQKCIPSTKDRVEKLDKIRKEKKYTYLISIDGGINDQTITYFKNSDLDIAVSGTYIVNSDSFDKQIEALKNNKSGTLS